MSDPSDTGTEPANLRFLRLLVTVLTGVMIFGLLTLIALFVMRFTAEPAAPPLPGELSLPEGATAAAVTWSATRILVVTDDDRLFVFSPDGTLDREIPLAR